jgi:hypothetical protein
MQTLVFNTTTKTVVVYEGAKHDSKILFTFLDVPTVKVLETYYEVMVKIFLDGADTRVPVGRFPISNTNMLIES